MLGGRYEPDEGKVDLQRMSRARGFTYLRDRVTGVDVQTRTIRLEASEEIAWSAISFNVGSVVGDAGIEGAAHATAAKPIRGLVWLREFLTDPPGPIVVLGGGATGCEIAANAAARTTAPVILVTRGERLLPGYPPGAGRWLRRHLQGRGIEVRSGRAARAIEPAGGGGYAVHLEGAERVAAAEVILATGLRPSPLAAEFGLPTGRARGLAVEATLRADGLEAVFGAGDCIDFGPRALPKLGVYAVRQSPVLLRNLLDTLDRGAPEAIYRPQRRALSILNLGEGHALAAWGRGWAAGRWCMRWKDRLDRKFLALYRT